MRNLRDILLPITLAAASLSGCDSAPSTQGDSVQTTSYFAVTTEYCGSSDGSDMQTTATTLSGDYVVELMDFPQPVPTNTVFEFKVRITGSPDSSEKNLGIIVDAAMPHHAHGMNVRPQPSLLSDDNVFSVDGMMFHMPGAWELYIDVVDGPYTERVTLDVQAG